MEKYCDVFDSEPGKTKDVLVNIPVPSETKSIFYKARPVPLSDGSVRICGDYKVTVNKVTQCVKYSIARAEDLLVTFNGGERFSKLYLNHAYHQLVLEEGSRKYLILNTDKSLFERTRLQYGIHSETGIFQREMEKRLINVHITVLRMNDILISGKKIMNIFKI